MKMGLGRAGNGRGAAHSSEGKVRNSRYMPGLDGLRAIAVLAVIAYHLNLSFAPGGLLGVGMFFVLSGYLITDILISQWLRTGRIDFSDFWLRRAKRLLPALLFMLVVVVAFITLTDRIEMASLRGDLLAALLYVSNWWAIFHHLSYFASFGPPSPIGHLWSLAVEEQFYLIWPLLLAFLLRRKLRRGWILLFILAAAGASAGAMAALYQPGMDPSRVYYGTDTRAFALLIGAALAVMFPSRKFFRAGRAGTRWTLDAFGMVGLGVILFMIWQTNQYETFLYQGGLVVLSVVTAVVIAALAHPSTLLGCVLGVAPLRWLGQRSYGIYLWHYPVILLTSPAVNTVGLNIGRAMAQVAVSILLADLSYRFVEEPIRHGVAGRLWAQIKAHEWRRGRVPGRLAASTSAVLAFGVSCFGVAAPLPAVSASGVAQVVTSDPAGAPAAKHTAQAAHPAHTKPGAETKTATPPQPAQSHTSAAHTAHARTRASGTGVRSRTGSIRSTTGKPAHSTVAATHPGSGVTAIGDSVMVDTRPYLLKDLPGVWVDGQVGRQMYQLPIALHDLRAKGHLGSQVIVELGTNGPFTKQQLVSMLQSLGPVKHIYLVNTRVPRDWQGVVNQTLAEVAATFPHTTLINWYAASAGKDSYFYPDGVHLNPTGAAYFATLLADAVKRSETNH